MYSGRRMGVCLRRLGPASRRGARQARKSREVNVFIIGWTEEDLVGDAAKQARG